MAQRKVYQANAYKDLDIYVMYGGTTKKQILFRGGSLQPRINGKYITSDPKDIEAIEKHSMFNVWFRCVQVDEIPEDENALLDDVKPQDQNTEADQIPEGFTKVEGIKTLQAAKEYLVKECGMDSKKLPNGVAVKNAAKENKVVFVDLK